MLAGMTTLRSPSFSWPIGCQTSGRAKPAEQTSALPAQSSAPAGQRLVSLDAMRGFAMFWIMGGRELLLAIVNCPPQWMYGFVDKHWLYDAVETQVTHPKWTGFVAWDMVMPVFLFLVGASMPFAFAKRVEREVPLTITYARIGRRVLVLWFFGMLAQGVLQKLQVYGLVGLELYSNTLQAIAVGYLVTSIALIHFNVAGQLALFATLTLSYGAILMFVPFHGHPGGMLLRTVNLPRYVDEMILGVFRREHSYTWIVTSLGFAASVLLGAMAGHLLRSPLSVRRKLQSLVAAGVVLATLGWIWSYWLPLNRHLWTSSMILWAGGVSFLMLALFYFVIDVLGFKAWAFPFVVIGANALFAYVFDHVFDRVLSDHLVMNFAQQCTPHIGDLIRAIAEVGLLWLILWYLYRQRTFLRA
jgi:predicted acyltransferase